MRITPRAGANTVPADGSRRDMLVGIARGALAGAAVAIGSDVAAQPSPAPSLAGHALAGTPDRR